jgi:hypothetical protein
MTSFEDHLWSQLVSDHGEQLQQAGEANATLVSSLRESGDRGWRRRMSSGRPRPRQLALAATPLLIACSTSVVLLAHTASTNGTVPPISRAAFTVTDNHDGTLTITLHNRSALPALDASLARYGLKAKLPTDASARTLSALTATCPKLSMLPGVGHPLALSAAGPRRAPLPGKPRPLRSCLLRTS